MRPSTERVLSMLATVGKEKIIYKFGDVVETFIPPKFVCISQNFFRSYKCYEKCGWCCLAVTLDYYQCDIQKTVEKYPEISAVLQEVEIDVNDKKKKIFVYDQSKSKLKKCSFLKNEMCSVHESTPWGCRFELYKMRRVRDVGYITLQMPSRPWIKRAREDGEKVCAKCTLHGFDEEQKQKGIQYLEELLAIANELEVKTWIPEIIEIVKNVKEMPKERIPVATNEGV